MNPGLLLFSVRPWALVRLGAPQAGDKPPLPPRPQFLVEPHALPDLEGQEGPRCLPLGLRPSFGMQRVTAAPTAGCLAEWPAGTQEPEPPRPQSLLLVTARVGLRQTRRQSASQDPAKTQTGAHALCREEPLPVHTFWHVPS